MPQEHSHVVICLFWLLALYCAVCVVKRSCIFLRKIAFWRCRMLPYQRLPTAAVPAVLTAVICFLPTLKCFNFHVAFFNEDGWKPPMKPPFHKFIAGEREDTFEVRECITKKQLGHGHRDKKHPALSQVSGQKSAIGSKRGTPQPSSAAAGLKNEGPSAAAFIRALTNGQMLITVRAKPGAKQSRILSPAIDVQINALPRDGAANEELCAFIAKILDLKGRDVTLQRGSKSRDKVLLVQTTKSLAQVIELLGRHSQEK